MKARILIFILTFCFMETYSQTTGLFNVDFLMHSTVNLFQPLDTTSITGSATIVKKGEVYYLLTAAHIAKDMKSNSLAVFIKEDGKPYKKNLVGISKNGKLSWQYHPSADIAILQIIAPNEFLKSFYQKWAFPQDQIITNHELFSMDAELTFFGFPIWDLSGQYCSPIVFEAKRSSKLITTLRADDKTKANDFFFISNPGIGGASGSGVYYSVQKASYFGGDKTFMIGIIHGTQTDQSGGKLGIVTPTSYLGIWIVILD